jgi:gamma-glutamylcyclotransferase (GGCT)/AIG2-like uncharacterized protein YtfP
VSDDDVVKERLFVYGTLAPGRPNEHVLAEVDGEWEAATVRGTLVQEGWGAGMGYPAVRLAEEAEEVHGFLFVSEHLEDHWARLDDFEGDEYERVPVTAKRSDGRSVDAQVYVHKLR